MKSKVALILAAGLMLTACASNAEPAAETSSPSPTNSLLNAELPSDLTAAGVLLAAVIIKSGDLEEAVANGLVSPAEIDEAIKAIEAGTLNLWKERAEADLG